jgi:hypothetical protein
MTALHQGTYPRSTAIDHASEDPEALMDEVWRLVERIRTLATNPERYHVDLVQEGAERGDLNLLEFGLHRFRDVEPLEDDDD